MRNALRSALLAEAGGIAAYRPWEHGETVQQAMNVAFNSYRNNVLSKFAQTWSSNKWIAPVMFYLVGPSG